MTRLMKAALKDGVDIARIEIETDGKIIIIAGKAAETANGHATDIELDEFVKRHDQA